jgi:putative hydrolase of the HAD superfamily
MVVDVEEMSSLRDVRAVVFDFYFTLADPVRSGREFVDALVSRFLPRMTRAEFDERRAVFDARSPLEPPPVVYDGTAPPYRGFRQRWTEYGDALFASLGVDEVGTHWAAARAAAHATAPLYPGTRAVLDGLRRRGLRLGVVSDADRDYLDASLVRHALEFDAVVASEDLACYKPHRAMFDTICRALTLEPAEVLCVGDGPETDVDGARRAGLHAVWVERGHVSWPDRLARPRHTIRTLDDLCALLDGREPDGSA